MALLPHNEKIYKELSIAIENNDKVCFVHGTGLGKSFIFFEICKSFKKGDKVLYVIPKWSIADNIMLYPEYAQLKADVTFKTYNFFKTIQDLSEYDLVVFDEVHHIASDKYGKNALQSRITGKMLGLTATNRREDKIDVCKYFDKTVLGLSTFDAIRKGLIPPFEYLVCRDDKEELLKKWGKSWSGFDKWIDYVKSIPFLKEVINKNPRNRWICFFHTIEALEAKEETVKKLFPKHHIIKITTKHDAHINDISRYKRTVVMCVDKLLEGVHVDVDGIILFRNVQSLTVFQQILGRVVHVGATQPPIILDCTQVALKMLAKLLKIQGKESKSPGTESGTSQGKPLLTCSLINTEHFNLTKLLAFLADSRYGNRWTPAELAMLKEHYEKTYMRDMLKLLPRHTKSSISAKAKQLGLKNIYATCDWTKQELTKLREGLKNGLNYRQVTETLPGRTIYSVKAKAKKLGLATKDWTWAKDDIAYLRKNYGKIPTKDIASHLNRSYSAIKAAAIKYKVTSEKTGVTWTEDMVAYLKENYNSKTRVELSQILGVSRTAISCKANALGIQKGYQSIFTPEMDEVLKRDYDKKDKYEIAKELNMTPNQIASRASYLGISKRKLDKDIWSEDKVFFLKDNYKTMDRNEIAKHIGVRPEQVTQKAYKLGLRKEREAV